MVSSSGVGSHMILILPPMMISSPGMLTGQPVEVPRLDISGHVSPCSPVLYPDYVQTHECSMPVDRTSSPLESEDSHRQAL